MYLLEATNDRESQRNVRRCNYGFEIGILLLYCIKNQQDATFAVLFISNRKITLHVSDAFCVHHKEY
jgi:hypothetical protein